MCRHSFMFSIIIVFIMIITISICAQEQTNETEVEDSEIVNLDGETGNSTSALKAFFDQYFQAKIAELNIPGLAYAFIDNDEIAAAGFGYADIDRLVTVDPETTVFPMNGISKTLTATAILQLTELADLDLSVDINQYLKTFDIENRYPRPITLSHLLTHSSGLSDDDIGIYARDITEVEDLDEYLAENLPFQVMPPGKVGIYGDYGFGLAGLVVQEVSGLDFAEYMDKYIFEPLAMHKSSFNWAAANQLDQAIGYIDERTELTAHPLAYPRNLPANGLRSSVRDIISYVEAHLNGGELNNYQILSAGSLESMQQLQFTQHSKLPGWTYGFYEHHHNGKRIILHGGDARSGYSCILFILPEENFGMVVAVNTYLPEFGLMVVNDFIDWHYPAQTVSQLQPQANAVSRANWVEGNYTLDYPSLNSIASLRRLFTQIHVVADEGGVVTIDFPKELDLPQQWVEIEPLLYRAVDSEKYLAFIDDDYGRITHLYAGGLYNFSKVPWHKTTEFTILLLVIFGAIFTLICLVWLIRKIRNRGYRGRIIDNFQQNMAALISFLNLVFIGGLILYIRQFAQVLIYELPPVIYALLAIPIVSICLTIVRCLASTNVRRGRWPFFLKLYHLLMSLSFILFFIYLWYWNLIGFW